jgi:nucleoside 2-deoxyribosyltransferase
MNIPVIYVAGPYRGPNAWEIEQNVRRAEELALEVWRAGAAALCPHTNTRFFQGAAPDQIWLDGDLAFLAKCDAILMTPDWQRSVGASTEHAFAVSRGMPILYTFTELKEFVAQWIQGEGYQPS